MLAMSTGSVALAQTCAPTPITPYVNVDGTGSETSTTKLRPGRWATLGLEPAPGGSWSTAEAIRFTTKDGVLYATAPGWPRDGLLRIPTLTPGC
jgi:hypothetical protein